MYKLKPCNEGNCRRSVYAVGKCSQHYHAMVFGGDRRIMMEEEYTCSNPLCGAEITQAPMFRGVVPQKRKEYCASCQRRDSTGSLIPEGGYLMECYRCGHMDEYDYLKRHGMVCKACLKGKK